MHRWHPLPNTNPEFCVIEFPGCREYRVENRRLERDGSGRRIQGTTKLRWLHGCATLCLAVCYRFLGHVSIVVALLTTLVFVLARCSQVLSESVVVFPPHGIQLETCYGLSSLPLTTRRRFISSDQLEDIIVNEGLFGWNVRFYLAVVKRDNVRFRLEVAYENLLPYQSVLQEVYLGITKLLLVPDQNMQ